MKFEDENFEEEFMNWLNSKTEEELVESLKKYAVNTEEYSYKALNANSLTEDDYFNRVEIKRMQSQIKVKTEKKDTDIEISWNIDLEVAA